MRFRLFRLLRLLLYWLSGRLCLLFLNGSSLQLPLCNNSVCKLLRRATDAFREGFFTTAESLGLADGEYQVEIELTGGSGKASLESPTKLVVSGGVCTATLTWSSPNYDYMIVDGEKYLPVNTEGNSVFEVPVSIFDRFVPVAADTTAMSTPHEIDYMIRLDSASVTQ